MKKSILFCLVLISQMTSAMPFRFFLALSLLPRQKPNSCTFDDLKFDIEGECYEIAHETAIRCEELIGWGKVCGICTKIRAERACKYTRFLYEERDSFEQQELH